MRPSYHHAHRAVPGALLHALRNALIPAGAGRFAPRLAIVVGGVGDAPRTAGGPGVRSRRGRSSPVLTRSPELQGQFPRAPVPERPASR
ncbi:hypothetical protein SGRI78S_04436 [Streptomyces griseus subsp. griseus]